MNLGRTKAEGLQPDESVSREVGVSCRASSCIKMHHAKPISLLNAEDPTLAFVLGFCLFQRRI